MEAVLTAEPDPAKAATDHLDHTRAPAKPRPIGSLICKFHDALFSHQ